MDQLLRIRLWEGTLTVQYESKGGLAVEVHLCTSKEAFLSFLWLEKIPKQLVALVSVLLCSNKACSLGDIGNAYK
jgi:hypothetical protein